MKDFMKPFRDSRSIVYEHIDQQKAHTMKCGYCGMTVAPNRGYEITANATGIPGVRIGYIYLCDF